MRAAPHPREAERLEALRAYGILDTPREKDFDDLAALAASLCETPVAFVSLIDDRRQWFKAEVGLGVSETPLDHSVCAHALLGQGFVEIDDLTADPRAQRLPSVAGEPGYRFYASVVLESDEGLPLGTLGVVDTKHRVLNDLQRETLRVLARQVMVQLELRRKVNELQSEKTERAKGEDFLRLITDRLPVRVGYIDRNLRYRFINGEYERMFGFPPGEAWGRKVEEIVGPEAFRQALPHIERALAGDTHTQEFTAPYPFGERRVEVQYVADRNSAGETQGVVLHIQDVTARFAAAQELQEGERRLRAANNLLTGIVEGTQEVVVALDCEYRFTAMNEPFRETIRRLFGKEVEIGGNMLDAIGGVPDDLARGRALWDRALAGERVELTASFGDPGFEQSVLDLRYFPIRDAQGEIVGAGEIAHDATERARAEAERERLIAELAAEREKLQDIFELAPTFSAVLRGEDLVFEYANEAYYRLAGRRDILGKSLLEALPEIANQGFEDILHRVMATGTPFEGREISVMLQRESGAPLEERFVDLLYQALRETDGTVSGVFAHGVDVTEGVLARRAIAESEARYRTLFTSMDEGFCLVEILLDEKGKPCDYRFLEINEAFERLTGIPGEWAREGRTAREAVPGLEDAWVEAYGAVALTGEPARFSQGSEAMGRWFDVRALRVGGEGSLRVAILFSEATERKRAEREQARLLAEIQTEKEKLQTLFRLAPAFIAVLRGRDLVFEYVNEAYYQIVGHRPIIGLPLREAVPETVGGGSGQDYDGLLLSVMDTGETRTFQGRPALLQRRPGEPPDERFLDLSYQPLRETDGTITGVLVHGIDVTDQIRARQEIAKREELFRTVFEQAPDDAIIVMELDRTISAWNPAAERICGWSAAEAVGRPADLIFTPDDRAKGAPDEETTKAAREGKAEDDRWHLRKDGGRFWGSGTMNALHDADGNVRGFLKVFRDATERYEEVKTLAFLRLLTDTVIDQRDPEGIIETVERMLGEYLGASRVVFAEASPDGENIVVRQEWGPDMPSLAGIHPLQGLGTFVEGEFRAGRTHVSFDAVRESGPESGLSNVEAFQIGSGISVPVMTEGRLASVVIVHQSTPREWTEDEIGLVRQVADRMSAEIERARAEAALRTSEERFRQLVDLSPSTVWFGEPDGGLSYISQDFYDVTGLTPEEALPHGWTSTIHPDDLPVVVADWEAARRDETLYDTEMRIRHRDGEYRWVSARALPLRDGDGRVTGWLGSNSDIHERKTAEETLQARVDERTEELQRAVKEAEGFNYSISHDLRTPLRAMVSTASILLEEAGEELSEEHRDLLVRQVENAKRLGRLIDELLRLSRLARVEVNREPLDMTRKAKSVFEELQAHDRTNGCRIEVQEGMTAEGDPGLVRTIFHNLLGNACKFSPEGGTIRVGQEGKTFSVSDEGVGFDMKFAPKIFLPFERLVSESQFEGTGIGLANVERIVRRHRGRVWAEGEPGKGATFFFTLG